SRCYHCKSELYGRITELLPGLGARFICSGANVDDLGDYRPGLSAAAEHLGRHPLVEAGCGTADGRATAQLWNVQTWDRRAAPCLASRLARGVSVTRQRLASVEAAEQALHRLGLCECRVRVHTQELARIEVPAAAFKVLLDTSVREQLVGHFHELGFRFVT